MLYFFIEKMHWIFIVCTYIRPKLSCIVNGFLYKYTLIQNSTFSKKINNSIKNRAKVTNNASNNRYFFALSVCKTRYKTLL